MRLISVGSFGKIKFCDIVWILGKGERVDWVLFCVCVVFKGFFGSFGGNFWLGI